MIYYSNSFDSLFINECMDLNLTYLNVKDMYTMTKMNRKTATSRIMYDILIMIGPVCLHISPPWMDLQNKTIHLRQ